jgi:branched-subunit amino acid aminotransferase/4-amino-4-deoxychorismate lyase
MRMRFDWLIPPRWCRCRLCLKSCSLKLCIWRTDPVRSAETDGRSVAKNAEFVPPYGMGSSMYVRPLLLGSGPELGLVPPKEFTFVVYVTPGTPCALFTV